MKPILAMVLIRSGTMTNQIGAEPHLDYKGQVYQGHPPGVEVTTTTKVNIDITTKMNLETIEIIEMIFKRNKLTQTRTLNQVSQGLTEVKEGDKYYPSKESYNDI